jgi:DNA polymerase (family 10)
VPRQKPSNQEIAGLLERIAELLEMQEANPFRVRAYRNAAANIRSTEKRLATVFDQGGRSTLEELPGIGRSLSSTIAEYIRTGRSSYLARLQGQVAPEDLFAQVPGIGDVLAERIARELDVSTLPELEQAAHDGRLAEVKGFGPKRLQAVQVSLAGMLSRAAQRRVERGGRDDEKSTTEQEDQPGVATLLEVDRQYRLRAGAGELPTIAPKRFNPEGEAWLPVLHTEAKGWRFTALYSNTARAHDLGATHDWVVLYYERDGEEDQATVVTERSGPLEGKRVVRGREAECRRYYQEGVKNAA